MARAKRTDRTDARRRYRADQAAQAAAIGTGEPPEPEVPARKAPTAPSARPMPERPSIGAAFKNAFHPLDLRGDIAALPRLVRHWSVWAPIGLSVLSTALFVATTSSVTDTTQTSGNLAATIAIIAYQLFVMPAPVGAAFLAGFGAPRASWLIGILVGIASAIGFAVAVVSPLGRLTYTEPTPWILQGFVIAPIGSAFFAAAAAWYRRFLNLANPNRGRPQPAKGSRPKARPVASRAGGRR